MRAQRLACAAAAARPWGVGGGINRLLENAELANPPTPPITETRIGPAMLFLEIPLVKIPPHPANLRFMVTVL